MKQPNIIENKCHFLGGDTSGDKKTVEITDAEIQTDIEGFKERIRTAQNKLAELPTGYLPYPEYKKREKKRDELQAEVEHVEKLIGIAQEALQ